MLVYTVIGIVPLPALGPVALIALHRQRAEALAHLVPGTLIAGVVDAAVEAGQASLFTEILPVGCLLWEQGADQYRSRAGNDRGVGDIGGMVRLRDERHNRRVHHVGSRPPGGGEGCRVFRIVRGDVGVHLQGSKWRQQPHFPRHTELLPAHQRIAWLPDEVEVLESKVSGDGTLGWRWVTVDTLQQCQLLLERCRANGRGRLRTELITPRHQPGLPGAHQWLQRLLPDPQPWPGRHGASPLGI